MARQSYLKKSKALLFALLVIPLLLIVFTGLLAMQGQQMSALQQRNLELEENLTVATLQAEFYKKAYDVTLHDVMTLSKIYGGEQKYSQTAGRLRAQELSVVFAKQNISGPTYEAKNPTLWSQYAEQGVIQTQCLPEAYAIETLADELLLVLSAKANGERDLYLYLDGNIIARFPVIDTTTHILNLKVPSGVHEFTLLSKTGGVSIEEIHLDTVEFPLNRTVVDNGESWEVFDCINATNSTILTRSGAVRVFFEKK